MLHQIQRIAASCFFGFFISSALGSISYAGEIDGIGGCDLSSPFLGCDWKPKGCYEPRKPSFFVSDVRSYNDAVDEYNEYLSRVRAYKSCVIADGKADIESRFQDVVIKGATKAIEEIDRDAVRVKSDLESSRPLAR
jgi:hypothetical protein